MENLYEHLCVNGLIRQIEDYRPDYLQIHSPKILSMIADGDPAWEQMVPDAARDVIKKRGLFGATKLA
jgi:hypothetical protein